MGQTTRLIILLLVSTLVAATVTATNETIYGRCRAFRSPNDPSWFDLGAAVERFDFSTPPLPRGQSDLAKLDSENLDLAVQSRLKILRFASRRFRDQHPNGGGSDLIKFVNGTGCTSTTSRTLLNGLGLI